MNVSFRLNGAERHFAVAPGESLLALLRRTGVFSARHGCEGGQCGACAIVVDGRLRPTCVMLAAQAEGRELTTVEALTGGPGTGGKGLHPMQPFSYTPGTSGKGLHPIQPFSYTPGTSGKGLHPIQQAFVDCGGVQCGYCTPAMILATHALLQSNPTPTEAEARECLSGVLCRCTGYVKPVQAVLRAAALLRGEAVPAARPLTEAVLRRGEPLTEAVLRRGEPLTEAVPGRGEPLTEAVPGRDEPLTQVGVAAPKMDAPKLASGRPVFTDDYPVNGMLYGKLVHSPHAHARIRRIDAAAARALPGVHAVLTHQDIPRVTYTTAGQSWPEPSNHDARSLDNKVRFVGDRVAAIAAETPEIAEAAARLIAVEYEVLPPIIDPREAMRPGAPVIHDEPDAQGFAGHDFSRNLAAHIDISIGDPDAAFARADLVVESTYEVPRQHQVSIEPHVCVSWWDEDDRLVVRSSTQVPFHVRRIIAPLLGLPERRIRVIKPRIGGGFGGKQEVLIEDICAHLTMATGRPVRLEYTREEEFSAARSRHPQLLTVRTGVMRDGTIVASELRVLANTGAYGCHSLTVQSNTGLKVLPIYRTPNLRFTCDAVYTNTPPAGAMRGYGVPQGTFAQESHIDEIARALGMDAMALRARNWVRVGDANPFSEKMNEGKEAFSQQYHSCGLAQCVERGMQAIGWAEKRGRSHPEPDGRLPRKVRGVGGAIAMQGSAIPGVDMGSAMIKINDDGSFSLLVGATDIGTGADTVLAQIAAEVLGVTPAEILVYAGDTDLVPFDTGAYASSTTYISGMAVKKAAERAASEIRQVAARRLGNVAADHIRLGGHACHAPDGRSISLREVALHSLHVSDQQQIMGTASATSLQSPPPFTAQFAEVEVDTETGEVRVLKQVSAVDCGRAINPVLAEGQIEGAAAQALGYAICEEGTFDDKGGHLCANLRDYHIFDATEMPAMESILVQPHEPHGPYGAKAIAEIPMNAMAPAIANSVADATGVRVHCLPLTPERVLRALRALPGPAPGVAKLERY